MNIKNPCKKVELRARFVVVTTKLVPESPYRRLIAEYLSFQTDVSADLLTPKFSLNVVLGLNIQIRQKSQNIFFDDFWYFQGAVSLKGEPPK